MQIGILESKKFSDDAILFLKKIGQVNIFDGKDLNKFLNSLDILFVRLSFKIDKVFIDKCSNLKWICSPTTGHNHLDLEYINKKKINVITLRGETKFLKSIKATPEHTFGLILAILRRYGIAFNSIKEGDWNREKCIGEELYNNIVGIIGFGRVGQQVARYCKSFGAKVIYYDIKDIKSRFDLTKSDNLSDLIKKSRIVVLCADYKSQRPLIIGQKEIKLLQNKFFINSSRGELVDEKFLLETAVNGKFLGIALDVISNENSKNNLNEWKELMEKQNVIITPHIGGFTEVSIKKTELFIAEKLKIAIGRNM